MIHRLTLPALLVDRAVERQALAALTPFELENALAIVQAEQTQQTAAERMGRRQLQRAEDAVEEAHQAYLNADPGNRRVRADLEARYEAALERLDRLRAERSASPSTTATLTPEAGAELLQLAGKAQELWSAPTTTNEDRKRLFRTLITHVEVHNATEDGADLEIVWVSGVRQRLPILFPRGVQKVVAERTSRDETVSIITKDLRADGVITATGRPISENVVRQKLREAGIPSTKKRAWERAHHIIRQGLMDGTQRREILRQLNEQAATRLSRWTPQRLADVISDFRHGVPAGNPLPKVLPADLERQRVLNIIEEHLGAGDSYVAIATHLNALGLKPQRGAPFNRNIVYQLHLRSRRRPPAEPAHGTVPANRTVAPETTHHLSQPEVDRVRPDEPSIASAQ